MRTKEEILKGEDEETFLAKCYLDPSLFFTRVLGYDAKDFHKEWIYLLRTKKLLAISAPTGFGKTTVFGVFYPIWMAFYHPKSVSLIISKSIRTQSSNVLEDIRTTIETNEILKSLVPEDNTTWTKEKIITTNFSKILYSSFSINVRGIQADYTFNDEVATFEDHELFFRDVLTRTVSKDGQLAAVSTCITTSDLLARLMNDTIGFYSRSYPALVKDGKADINGESIWPERFTKERLLNIRAVNISLFEKNYMCNPVSEASDRPIFSIKHVVECYDLTRSFTKTLEGGVVYIGCDFAISSGPRADFDAYVVIEMVNDYAIIRHIERKKGLPTDSKILLIEELCKIYHPARVIIDKSLVGDDILRKLLSKGIPAYPQEFSSNSRKKLLVQLQSLIDNKKIVIPRKIDNEYDETVILTNVLTEELIGFQEAESRLTRIKHLVSTSAHDDTVMALAMACSSLSFASDFEDTICSEDSVMDNEENKTNTQEEELGFVL